MKGIGIAVKTNENKTENLRIAVGLNSDRRETQTNIDINIQNNSESKIKVSPNVIEFHMNIWKPDLKLRKSYKNFHIDFGVKFSSNVESLRIYIPFLLKKRNKWSDLGSIMVNNNEILCSILNKNFAANKLDQSCFYNLKDSKSENVNSKFFLYTLGRDNIKIYPDKDTKGTWIDIEIKNHPGNINDSIIYIRFRVTLKDARDYIIQKETSNNLIQAPFSKIDLIDVSLNNYHKLHEKVIEHLTSDDYNLCKFSKAHILFLSSSRVAVENFSSIKYTSKIINPDIWMQYEPPKYYYDIFIGHHWRFPDKDKEVSDEKDNQTNKGSSTQMENINLFFTTKYPKTNFWTLISYIFIALFLGGLGSFLGSVGNISCDTCWQNNYIIYILGGLLIVPTLIWLIRNYRVLLKILPRPFKGWIIKRNSI